MRPDILIRIFMLLGLIAFHANGQPYRLLHYTVADGLPANTVYDIYAAPNGLLWFATDKGIARFDGLRFEHFTTGDGLPDNEVFLLQEDWYGRLWIGTCNGQLGYYKNGRFYTGKNIAGLRFPFKSSMINQIQQEKDSSLTVFFRARTHFVNISGDQYHYYPLETINRRYPQEDVQTIRKIAPDRYRIVYTLHTIVIDTAMHILQETTNRAALYYTKKNLDGSYFINDTLYTENFTVTGKAFSNKWSDYRLNIVFRDKQGYLITTTGGAFINGMEPLLRGLNISCVNKDREGNYWLGTIGNGLYVLDRYFRHTRYYTAQYKGIARYARADSAYLFICTQNKSLFRFYNGQTECIFNARKYVSRKSEQLRNAYLIDSGRYYALGNDENYTISDIYNAKPQCTAFPVRLGYINEVFRSGDYLSFFTTDDVYRIARNGPGKNQLHKLPHVVPYGDVIYAKAAAPDGSIWFSTGNNVYCIRDTMPVIMPQFGSLSFRAFGFYGTYLAGYTHNNTLVVCNHYYSNHITFDSVKNTNHVWDKLYRLDDNHILISTNSGYCALTLYPSDDKPLFSLQVVADPFIPPYAEYICADGKNCYFLKDGDITSVPLFYLYRQKTPPATAITAVKTATAQYENNQDLTISYTEAKYIGLTLAAPALKTKVVFEYSVTGTNDTDNWQPLNGAYISLYNLGYGYYTIKARARTESAIPGAPAILMLHISRPFWAVWWFRILCAAAALFAVWCMVRYSIRHAIRKKEQAHDLQVKFLRSEYRSLNALMNPHFIFNALNSVQWLINSDDKAAANEYLHTFSRLVRQNMQNLSQERITLQQEINLVTNYLSLEKLRFKSALHYEIAIDEYTDPEDILVPPLLLQPLVENSIRHGFFNRQGSDNKVWITVAESSSVLQIQVRDNGAGLHSRAQETVRHHSYGLQNIRQRLDQLALIHKTAISLHIEELHDTDGHITGTEVTITLSI